MPSFAASDYEYPELPEDTPLLCTIREVKEIENRFAGQRNDDGREAPSTQLQVDFEIVEGDFRGERIRTWMNPTFGPKSNLAKLACAVLNVEWSRELRLDTDELKGKQVYLIGDYGDDGKSVRLKPRKYKPVSGTGSRHTRQSERSTETKREPAAAGARASSADVDLDF